jgi:hypothetical protein
MRYLSEDDATQMMGLGYVGEVYQGLDGHLYEWVEGVDAWGDSIGFWQGWPQPGFRGRSGLGALYQAPDGALYQVQGLSEEEEAAEAEESGESEAPRRWAPAGPAKYASALMGKGTGGFRAMTRRANAWGSGGDCVPEHGLREGRPVCSHVQVYGHVQVCRCGGLVRPCGGDRVRENRS